MMSTFLSRQGIEEPDRTEGPKGSTFLSRAGTEEGTDESKGNQSGSDSTAKTGAAGKKRAPRKSKAS